MRGLCQWWLESITSPCVPLKIRVQSWNKNANIQLKMAQNTHQVVLSPLCHEFMKENDKKYHLFDIQNIISLLLLHINYFYCRPESMVWRGLLKMSMCYSLGLQPVMPWKVVTSLGERPTGKKWCQPGCPLEGTMGLLPFLSVYLLPGCVETNSFFCWMLPSRCSTLFQKWRQQEEPAWVNLWEHE